ncbi:hypothetical protein [Tessaracoccus sp. Y1736]
MHWTAATDDLLTDPAKATALASGATIAIVLLGGAVSALGRLVRPSSSQLRRRAG